MTEQEEDEELLSDLNTAKSNVIQFDESPAYIKGRYSNDIFGSKCKSWLHNCINPNPIGLLT